MVVSRFWILADKPATMEAADTMNKMAVWINKWLIARNGYWIQA
jgi:hypothetical protein